MRLSFGTLFAFVFISVMVTAETKTPGAGSAAKKIYAANCATCHGPDGKGNSTGRAMGAKDLQSAEVIKMSDQQIKQVISSGKGNMPPWKGQLSDAQIAEVAGFVRSLQKTAKK